MLSMSKESIQAVINSTCPHGQPGDRLWVRETFAYPNDQVTIYRANWREDAITRGLDNIPKDDSGIRWTPSIHMPRWASRITLEITNIRVKRLNEITRGGALQEGCPFGVRGDQGSGPREWFADLWESINGTGSWGVNPWVWVIEFRKLEGGK
jgi:hypothetical protein